MKDVKSDPRFSTIVLLAQTGDRQALEKVLRKYQKPVYYYILRITGKADTAEDLTQDTLIQVVQKLKYLREPAALSTWIYRIATRIVFRQLKSKSRLENHEDLDSIAELSDNGIELLKKELELDFLSVVAMMASSGRPNKNWRKESSLSLEKPVGSQDTSMATTLAPSSRKAWVNALPMPRAAPVIATTFPLRSDTVFSPS